MFESIVRALWLVLGWLELALFTALLYLLSFLPKTSIPCDFRNSRHRWTRCGQSFSLPATTA